MTLTGNFQLTNPQASEQFAELLRAVQIEGAQSQKVVVPPAEVKDAGERWVSWQVRGDVGAIRGLLDRGGKKE